MKVAIGCDHIAISLKTELKNYLDQRGIEYCDFGTYSEERTDYPIYAEKVARAVATGEYERGILLCGTGVGMAISANKIPGIRAVVCSEPYSAAMSRSHNNTNILCMGIRVVGPGLATLILEEWLDTVYEGGRHQRRLDMIAGLEGEA
jgi:ribose 5-phosphate isomerase B